MRKRVCENKGFTELRELVYPNIYIYTIGPRPGINNESRITGAKYTMILVKIYARASTEHATVMSASCVCV